MKYPATMPRNVLLGSCRKIERWCAENNKVRPTLLDLALARKAVKKEGGHGRSDVRRRG